jgi:phosphohistidine swiveling domain-containing protein
LPQGIGIVATATTRLHGSAISANLNNPQKISLPAGKILLTLNFNKNLSAGFIKIIAILRDRV